MQYKEGFKKDKVLMLNKIHVDMLSARGRLKQSFWF